MDIQDFLVAAKQAKQANAGRRTMRYPTEFTWGAPAHYLYFDYETPIDSEHSLGKLSQREYLAWVKERKEQCTVAFAEDDDEPIFAEYGDENWYTFLALYCDDVYLKVSHNSTFDDRVSKLVFDLPWPLHSHCTMELAYRCWPNQLGGHSLGNLATTIPGIPHKLDIDLTNCTREELEAYNVRDVEGCRALHKIELGLVPPEELLLAEQASRVRAVELHINRERAKTAQDDFATAATKQLHKLLETIEKHGDKEVTHLEDKKGVERLHYGADKAAKSLFGMSGDKVRSINYQQLSRFVNEELGFKTNTVSYKKVDVEKKRQNPLAGAFIDRIGNMGKLLTHARRSANMAGVAVTDVNYRYYAAHTGRPSGKAEGKRGHNVLNIPKRNKDVANIIRPMYEMPPGLVTVSGDLANAEYRALGLMTRCKHIATVFGGNALADPYSAFCGEATGIWPDKNNPEDVPLRNVFKQGVLSLNFLCGLAKWMSQILLAIADGEVTLEQLEELADKQNWQEPFDNRYYTMAKAKTSAPDKVAALCYHTYNMFHDIHPEFRLFGNWLVGCLEDFAGATDPERCLERWKDREGAPDPELVGLTPDWDKKDERSIAVRCGYWSPTVFWRQVGIRMAKKFDMVEPCLTMLHKNKGFRSVSKSLVVENCFAGSTLVLTSEGWKRIDTIKQDDRLWDGCDFVASNGRSDSGEQETVSWLGVDVTPNHLILDGKQWVEAHEARYDGALWTGLASDVILYLRATQDITRRPLPNASAALPEKSGTCLCRESLLLALSASLEALLRLCYSYPTQTLGMLGNTAIQGSYRDATTLTTRRILTTAAEVSRCAPNGYKTVIDFLSTLLLLKTGTYQDLSLTASTTAGTMNRGISDWSRRAQMLKTVGTLSGLLTKANRSLTKILPPSTAQNGNQGTQCDTTWMKGEPQKRLSRDTTKVYDIVDSGPRNRFTILTSCGPVIVHNCAQSFSRNGMSELKLRLETKYGFRTMFDIYDEARIIVPVEEAGRVRKALLAEAGPGSDGCGYGWACLIDPREIECSPNFKGKVPNEEWWADPKLETL